MTFFLPFVSVVSFTGILVKEIQPHGKRFVWWRPLCRPRCSFPRRGITHVSRPKAHSATRNEQEQLRKIYAFAVPLTRLKTSDKRLHYVEEIGDLNPNFKTPPLLQSFEVMPM